MRTGRERHTGALARLLLVVVLALGVFVMHSVGHPDGPAAAMDGGAMTHASTQAHSEDSEDSAPSSHAPGHGTDTGTGMDMTTLCVAVLGAWLLAALVRAALARRPGRTVPLPARLRPGLGPHAPPPRPPDLASLSILRI
ncbi:DUF6153 family protein [Streptomyces sp. NPDC101160]|uniref:DUF6153 family protein n=1 Tax=Streptomyces sp. NPDC101160 TaxID=3366118 RepID=UPI0038235D5F